MNINTEPQRWPSLCREVFMPEGYAEFANKINRQMGNRGFEYLSEDPELLVCVPAKKIKKEARLNYNPIPFIPRVGGIGRDVQDSADQTEDAFTHLKRVLGTPSDEVLELAGETQVLEKDNGKVETLFVPSSESRKALILGGGALFGSTYGLNPETSVRLADGRPYVYDPVELKADLDDFFNNYGYPKVGPLFVKIA